MPRHAVFAIITLIFAAAISALAPAAAADATDYNIIAPDFDGFVLSPEASVDEVDGSYVLTVSTPDLKWTFCTYTFAVDPIAMKRLSFSYNYKTEDVVRGENNWNTARIWVNFFDDADQHINDWPSPGFWMGTRDWRTGKWTLAIPKDAVKATLYIGLDSCSGTLMMKDFVLYAQDANKANVEPLPPL